MGRRLSEQAQEEILAAHEDEFDNVKFRLIGQLNSFSQKIVKNEIYRDLTKYTLAPTIYRENVWSHAGNHKKSPFNQGMEDDMQYTSETILRPSGVMVYVPKVQEIQHEDPVVLTPDNCGKLSHDYLIRLGNHLSTGKVIDSLGALLTYYQAIS